MRAHGGSAEPLPRRELLGAAKLAAEGRHAEVQLVLGWEEDDKALTIRLPKYKYMTWKGDINPMSGSKSTSKGELESTLGRLEHAYLSLPLGRNFMTRLRHWIDPKARKFQRIQISNDEKEDLSICATILDRVSEGVSLNLVVHRQLMSMGASDSCPQGDFTLKGSAWRIRIPKGTHLRSGSKSNNLLEFLGMAVNIWIMCEEAEGDEFECILALGDNTSALGWIFRAGKLDRYSKYFSLVQIIARKITRVVYKYNVCLSS